MVGVIRPQVAYAASFSLPMFVICRGSRSVRVVYLTFDDGPNPRATEPILETLAAESIPAAFFMVGENVHSIPLHCGGSVAEWRRCDDARDCDSPVTCSRVRSMMTSSE